MDPTAGLEDLNKALKLTDNEENREAMSREVWSSDMDDTGHYRRFPHARVSHLSALESDHTPLILNNEHGRRSQPCDRGRRVCRFEAMWLHDDECKKVVSDAWLASLGSDHTESLLDLPVASLIDHDRNESNSDMISELFHPLDSTLILAIPLGHSGTEDKLIWHSVLRRRFMVKSAHHLALTLSEKDAPFLSS
ncbi:hypothetical protein Salat_2124600 [Sesamum alatum]|uniref:Uncharacterized protein n=1 Tax=Sesamum alatum TaxID=300844 RepID=A0AAE1Y125_9LAMI|nr:hypothetical protein Salat_2124600 [Sesamum alatum]